jgi:hypothetical protein
VRGFIVTTQRFETPLMQCIPYCFISHNDDKLSKYYAFWRLQKPNLIKLQEKCFIRVAYLIIILMKLQIWICEIKYVDLEE